MRNFYQILGISEESSEKEIKIAFRKLAKEYHPDKNPGNPQAEKKFKEFSEAYDVLSDPQKRREYDQALHAPSNPFAGFGFDFSSMFGDFGDLFHARRHRGPRQNEDLGIKVSLGFWESVKGCKKEISFVRPFGCKVCDESGVIGNPQSCGVCKGSGRIDRIQGHVHLRTACRSCRGSGKTSEPCSVCAGRGSMHKKEKISFSVPPGVDNGQVIRIQGKGSQASRSLPAGNLMIELNVEQRFKNFNRSGFNIHSEETINFTRAVLGGEIIVETIFGNKKVKIPPGTSDGSTMMISSAGIKSSRKTGDHYVKIRINIPSSLTEEQKNLLEKLDDTF